MSPARKGTIALIIANIIWGFASPIFKIGLENITPFILAFLRFSIASILLGIFLGKKTKLPVTTKHDWYLLVAYAISAITVNILFFFFGLRLTLAMNAPIIASAQPILTFLFAFLFLKEKQKLRKVIGMIIGTLGILVIILEPIFFKGIDGNVLGNLLLLIATIGAVIGTLIGRTIFQKYDPLTLMFWAFVIGACSFLPPALVEYSVHPTVFQTLDIRGISGIVYGSLFSSAIAYALFAWGLARIPASEASLFTYIDPIAGTILSFFLLREPVTTPFIIGSIAIFLGIFIAEKHIHYHPFGSLKNHEKPRKHPKEKSRFSFLEN